MWTLTFLSVLVVTVTLWLLCRAAAQLVCESINVKHDVLGQEAEQLKYNQQIIDVQKLSVAAGGCRAN